MIYFFIYFSSVVHSKNTKGYSFRKFFHSTRTSKVLVFLLLSGIILTLPNIHPAQAGIGDSLEAGAKALIYIFFSFFAWLTSLAAEVFTWSIDANTFNLLMNHAAMYEMWRVIRDFCNLFFIVILLFSAFATIFQLDKYDYRKTLPTLVVMALLVNFSFPISRFIIDLFNVIMYFFAQNVFQLQNAQNISEGILSASKMQDILLPGINDSNYSSGFDWKQLIAATICMFLFGISFLILALLMLVRMVSLAILVIFSPIGFVGLITPALRKFGDDWWNRLLKQASYGPLAIMFVLIAVKFMQVANETIHPKNWGSQNFQASAMDNNFLASVAFFAIPIVLFWTAITMSNKYANDISSESVSFARKAERWIRKKGMQGLRYGAYQTGIPGGIKQIWQDFSAGNREARERRERGISGFTRRGHDRVEQENKRLVEDAKKRQDIDTLGPDALRDLARNANADKYSRAAAMLKRVSDGTADRRDLYNIRQLFGDQSQVTRDFESKIRTYDPEAAFSRVDDHGNIVSGTLNQDRLNGFIQSNQFDIKKLGRDAITGDVLRSAMREGKVSLKDLDELRNKFDSDLVKGALSNAISAENADLTRKGEFWDFDSASNPKGVAGANFHRLMQNAFLSQSGDFHSSISRSHTGRSAILERASIDALKRLKAGNVNSGSRDGLQNLQAIASTMGGNYAEMLLELSKNGPDGLTAARNINNFILNGRAPFTAAALPGATPVEIANANNLQRIASNDQRIRHLT